MADEPIAKFPIRKAAVALNGTTNAVLVAAPPAGVAYVVRKIYGKNTAGGNRTLTLYFKEDTTATPIWSSGVIADTVFFTTAAGTLPNFSFDIVLSNTDESLEMDVDAAGTDVMYATYEVMES